MSMRLELPPRRESITQKAKIAGCTLYLTVGFFDEERTLPGEIFLTLDNAGSKERILVDALARMTSLALQRGAPLEEAMGQWLGMKGEVCGSVQGDHRIKHCQSALDYVARHMLVYYGQRDDLAHLPPAHGLGATSTCGVECQSCLHEKPRRERL